MKKTSPYVYVMLGLLALAMILYLGWISRGSDARSLQATQTDKQVSGLVLPAQTGSINQQTDTVLPDSPPATATSEGIKTTASQAVEYDKMQNTSLNAELP